MQYCKLIRTSDESAEEWMVRIRPKAREFNWKEVNRRLKELFISGINNQTMTAEIIKINSS